MQVGLLSLGDHLPDPHSGEKISQLERHREIVELAVRAEAAGFSSVWLGEHHLCDYILSAPTVVLSAIAERTTSLRLGTGVTLLANLDPVRVAEDYATVDLLSGGRVELVVGRGVVSRTYADFGQDFEDSREIYAENLDLLLRLWREEEVTWRGKHRAPLDAVTVQPRPAQTPHPPIWVGGGTSHHSIDLAATRRLPLMLPSVLAPPEEFAPLVERYRDTLESAGHDPARFPVGACSHVWVGESSQKARDEWRPYYLHYWKFVLDLLGWRGPSSSGGVDYDTMLKGPAICGSPAEVVDRILGMRELLGLDLHLSMLDLGGLPPERVHRTLDLFGEKVLPEVVG